MSTTSIVVELLVIGIQTLLWVAIAAGIGTFGAAKCWSGFETAIRGMNPSWAGTIAVLATAAAYTLGVITDRLYDELFERKLEKAIERDVLNGSGAKVKNLRYRILLIGGQAVPLLDYLRSRIRIARSASGNLFILAVLLCILGLFDVDHRKTLVTLCVLSTLFSGAALVAWRQIFRRFHEDLIRVNEVCKELKEEDDAPRARLIAVPDHLDRLLYRITK